MAHSRWATIGGPQHKGGLKRRTFYIYNDICEQGKKGETSQGGLNREKHSIFITISAKEYADPRETIQERVEMGKSFDIYDDTICGGVH